MFPQDVVKLKERLVRFKIVTLSRVFSQIVVVKHKLLQPAVLIPL